MTTAAQADDTSTTEASRRVIRASAGTGKTFQLSNWFLRELFAGAQLDQLLATTFTRKAAREILDRILVRLSNATIDDKERALLSEFTSTDDLSQDRCVKLLTEMTQQLHRMRVSTLDSFFSQIATNCSLDLGLPPGWAIIDHNDDRQLRRDAMELLLQDNENNDLIRLFHLVTVGESNRSITRLLEDAVNRAYSFYLESEEEAWQQFPEYFPLSESDLARTLEDFDNFDIPIGKTTKKPVKAWENDYIKANRAVDRGNWEAFLKTSIAERVSTGVEKYSRIEIDATTQELYGRLIQHARGIVVPQMAQQTQALYSLLERFDHFYNRLKEDRRWQTYDDITRRLRSAVHSMDLEQVSYRLDSRIHHLLLDEFQDTSLNQWEILRPFAKQVCATSKSGNRSFFCVGDVKQAIYSWRGGVAEIFDAVEDELPGLQIETLELSRRSSQAVIDIVNRVFYSDTLHEHPKINAITQDVIKKWTDKFGEHQTVRTELPGYCCLMTAPSADEINMARRDDDDAMDWKQNRVTIKAAADLVQRLAAEAPTCSIGVLCRGNRTIAELMFELRDRGVDASEEGGNPLTDSALVQAIVSLLKVIDHPGNTNAAFHVATSPLGAICGLKSFADSIVTHTVASQLRRRIAEIGLADLLESWTNSLEKNCSPRDARRLKQLIALARSSPAAANTRTAPFVEVIENEKVEDPSSERLRVMTIHKSKGLEFDIVVLPELDIGLDGFSPKVVAGRPTPTSRPDTISIYRNKTIQSLLPDEFQRVFETWTREGVTQSLCLLYVALTRAKHATYMMIAPSTRQYNLPSKVSGLLRWSLLGSADRVSASETLYDVGNPEWYVGLSDNESPEPDEPHVVASSVPSSIKLAEMPTGRNRGLSSVEPSSLEGAATIRINELLSLDRAERLERGTLLHRWFEEIVWLDDGPPDEQRLRLLAGVHNSLGLSIDEETDRFQNFLANPTVSDALCRKQYLNGQLPLDTVINNEIEAASPRLEVQREWGFASPGADGELVSGVIDRLVLMYDPTDYSLLAADIIDYKTDVVSDIKAVAQRVEFYHEQILAYRNAVSGLYRIPHERISARLLFVHSGDVCAIR
jgi:ATP-dependent helicase/nuclease subunit A